MFHRKPAALVEGGGNADVLWVQNLRDVSFGIDEIPHRSQPRVLGVVVDHQHSVELLCQLPEACRKAGVGMVRDDHCDDVLRTWLVSVHKAP
jgi:hypothetical protein